MVETFSLSQFEAALPTNKNTGAAMCQSLGLIGGEYQFSLPVNPSASILIRSSVRADGYSAAAHKDSIRVWLADPATGRPLAKKLSHHICRTGAWRDRLVSQLRTLFQLGKNAGLPCGCGGHRIVGIKEGRQFVGCTNRCGNFQYLTPQAA